MSRPAARRSRAPELRPGVALALGLALELALTSTDLVFAPGPIVVASLVLGPFLVAGLGTPEGTAVAGLAAVALAALSLAWNDSLGELDSILRLAIVAGGGLLAVFAASARARVAREAAQLALLASINEAAADGGRGVDEAARRLLARLVPALADAATLDLAEADGGLRHLAARVAGDDPEAEAALLRRRPTRAEDRAVHGETSRWRARLLRELDDEALLSELAGDEADHARLRALRWRSLVFVPLRARGRTVGALACARGSGRARFDAEDLAFAEILGGRLALALDNAGLSADLRTAELQFDATLANLAEAVTVVDPADRIVYANPVAATLLGCETPQQLIALSLPSLADRLDLRMEDGTPLRQERRPSLQALADGPVAPLLCRMVDPRSGAERWIVTKSNPLHDSEGRVRFAINVIEDITDSKRAEHVQRLLAEATRLLVADADAPATLAQLTQLVASALADWCAIDLVGRDGSVRTVAVARAGDGDGEAAALAQRWRALGAGQVADATATASAIRDGRSLLQPRLEPESLTAIVPDADRRALLAALGARSLLVVPVGSERRALGALTLVQAASGRRLSSADQAVAEELGRRAGVAIERAQLARERAHIASTLQHSLLPSALPAMPGWRAASLYRAAGELNEVGGDFYDVFRTDDGWMVVVGDVAGRGPEAAALTSLARYTIRTAGRLLGDPVATVAQLNVALREQRELSLVSVVLMLLRDPDPAAEREPGELRIVCAGHPLPQRVGAEGVQSVGEHGLFLGASDDGEWTASRAWLDDGDLLVAFTDGVLDCLGPGRERFGERRLRSVLAEASDPDDAVARIGAALDAFIVGPQPDDTAVLALQLTPRSAERRQPAAVAEPHAGVER